MPTYQSISWTDVAAEAVEHLSQLVAHGTSSPPAWEFPAAKYLLNLLESEGIPAMLLPPTRTSGIDDEIKVRPNLVAHIAGSGAGEPLLLLSHLDTAPRRANDLEIYGYTDGSMVRGPGSLMGIHLAVAHVIALILIARSGIPIHRTIRLAATSGGTSGEGIGLKTLVDNHLEHITSDVALGWGAFSWTGSGGKPYSWFSSGEKGSMKIKIRAEGPGGRTGIRFGKSSSDKLDPVERIVRSIIRLGHFDFKPVISDSSQSFVRSLIQLFTDLETRDLLEGLNNERTARGSLDKLRDRPDFDDGLYELIRASLRTEVNVVKLWSAPTNGLVPNTAEAVIQFNYPPGEDIEGLAVRLLKIIGTEGIYLAEKTVTEPSESTVTSELLAVTKASLSEVNRDTRLITGICPWPTGLSALRKYGTSVYGWEPFVNSGGLIETFNRRGGAGESVDTESFINSIRAFYSFLLRSAQ